MTVVDREADMAKQYAWRAYPPVGAMIIAAFTCMHRVPRIPQGSDLEPSTYSWSRGYCFEFKQGQSSIVKLTCLENVTGEAIHQSLPGSLQRSHAYTVPRIAQGSDLSTGEECEACCSRILMMKLVATYCSRFSQGRDGEFW